MNQSSTGQPPAQVPAQPSLGSAAAPPWRRLSRRAAMAAAVAVALFAGVGIGSASNSQAGALNTARRNLRIADQNLAAARTQLSTLRAQYTAEKGIADQATQTANTRAKAAYAARNAALDARARSLTRRAKAIEAAEGRLRSSRISTDGVYVVGQDIKPGVYHTSGDGGATDNECYFATLNSSDTSDIADNNNFDGPETVDVSGAYAFQIDGPCAWVRVS